MNNSFVNDTHQIILLQKPPKYRWIILILNSLGITFFFMVVQIFPSFSNEAMETLDISYATYGWISTSAYLTYGIFLLIGGPLGSKIGTKKIAALGIPFAITAHIFWPFCDSVIGFIILRLIGGISGGLYVGYILAATAFWFPTKERALASGILTGCIGLGYSIDSFFANILLNAGFEWKVAGALIIVVPGVLLFILYILLAKDFKTVYKGHTIVDEILPQTKHKATGSCIDIKYMPDTLGGTIKSPLFIAMSIAIMMNCGMVYTIASFLPLLLEVDMGFGAETAAAILSSTFLSMLLFSPIGGVVSDRFLGQKRSYALIAAFIVTLVTAIIIPHASLAVMPVILFLFYGGMPICNGPYWALPEEIFNPKFGGTLSSALLFMGVFAGTVAQPLIGALVDSTGTNMSSLYVYIAFSVIGLGTSIFIFIKEKQLKTKSGQSGAARRDA